MAFNDFPLGILKKELKIPKNTYWLHKCLIQMMIKPLKRRHKIVKCRTIYVFTNSEKCIFENYICDVNKAINNNASKV